MKGQSPYKLDKEEEMVQLDDLRQLPDLSQLPDDRLDKIQESIRELSFLMISMALKK